MKLRWAAEIFALVAGGAVLAGINEGQLLGAQGLGAVGPATGAINTLGLDLLAQQRPGANALLSPYSIQTALAMTFAGADGVTREEMAKVLHYTGSDQELHTAFAALRDALEELARTSAERAEVTKTHGGSMDPVLVTVANRLFGQKGYGFRQPFISLAKDVYHAPFLQLDFHNNPESARKAINQWVEEQTRERIQDLIPPDGVDRDTRLVLVNAIFLKAAWANPFPASETKPLPFYVNGVGSKNVPTMSTKSRFGYARRDGYSAIILPYMGGELQFLILLPDRRSGLAELEKKLTAGDLAESAKAPPTEVYLRMPKFKLEPPLLRMKSALAALGMNSAFNVPEGSANFDRMAPRKPDDYLFISEVFHKTFVQLDENGTEAAAASAVSMARATSVAGPEPKPIVIQVDHPFLFAIQHRASGACLFLGRVNDPNPDPRVRD